MGKFFSDFKTFINKGNIIELAIAVVIGGAFGKIVTSFVNNVISPLIGLLVGTISMDEMKIILRAATDTLPEIALGYGAFLQALMDFVIIAFFIFTALRLLRRVTQEAKKQIDEKAEKLKELLLKEKEEMSAETAQPASIAAVSAAAEVTTPTHSPAPAAVAPQEPDSAPSVRLLEEIRDLLKAQSK